jgi:hypothetical protein
VISARAALTAKHSASAAGINLRFITPSASCANVATVLTIPTDTSFGPVCFLDGSALGSKEWFKRVLVRLASQGL